MSESFSERLEARRRSHRTRLCVGLDPRFEKHGGLRGGEAFLEKVVAETSELALCYKPNAAYFEAWGAEGVALLERLVCKIIPQEVPVVLDAKRGDIAETQARYAQGFFEHWKVDAVTLSPYMGFDSIEPFLKYPGKAVFVLALTSNAGAADLQELSLEGGQRIYEKVLGFAARAASVPTEFGFVLGLTNITAERLRAVPDGPLLIPGLGAQGGELSRLQAGERRKAILINASRAVMYGEGEIHERAERLRREIEDVLG